MSTTTNFTHEVSTDITKSFMSFKLGEEQFAISVMNILEILEIPGITKVPKAPSFLKGVVNLRGNVLPVIDARIKFGMEPTAMTIDSCIIVLNIDIDDELVMVGALVDSVQEVFELNEEEIKPSPTIGSKYKAEFIHGMIKVDEHFLMLLNIGKVFSADDLETIISTQTEILDTDTKNSKSTSKNKK